MSGPGNGERARRERYALVTGGAGFVGSNVASRLLEHGHDVVLFDNLTRPSIERNVAWLERRFGGRVRLVRGDVRDAALVRDVVAGADRVFHFAAQVAVTTSLLDPLEDFEVNGRGTLHLLEALRSMRRPPPLLFTSTNKVYGALPDVRLARAGQRWEPVDRGLRRAGVGEDRPLDFHSPYGCSKGVADQYVVDYARTFGLPTVVFRMSCIYGTRQFGNEEQGWVAHFMQRAMADEPITLFGDGMQVRDVLFIDDLVDAMMAAMARVDGLAGEAFNVGGGPERAISLLDLLDRLGALLGRRPRTRHAAARPGDQRYYVSSCRRLEEATGWRARVSVDAGLERLAAWLHELRGDRAAVGETRSAARPGAALAAGQRS